MCDTLHQFVSTNDEYDIRRQASVNNTLVGAPSDYNSPCLMRAKTIIRRFPTILYKLVRRSIQTNHERQTPRRHCELNTHRDYIQIRPMEDTYPLNLIS